MPCVLNFIAIGSKLPGPLFTSAFALALLLLTGGATNTPAQGFGINKIKLRLEQQLPPKVYLAGTDFALQVVAPGHLKPQSLQRLKTGITQALLRFDPRLKPVNNNPETLITLTITDLRSSSLVENRQQTEHKKVGEHTQTDPQTGVSQTIEVFGNVTENYVVTIFHGNLSMRYEARDSLTGKLLDGENLSPVFKEEIDNRVYHSSLPSYDSIEQSLIDYSIRTISERYRRRFPAFTVALPKGKLKDVSDQLQQRHWNSSMEALQAMPEFNKATDEAFRLYSKGVACEGLAYESSDFATIKEYLAKASHYYSLASRKNPDEQEFALSLARANRARQAYHYIEPAYFDYQARRRTRGQVASQASGIPQLPPAYAIRLIRNDVVIGWLKAGVPEKEILRRIDSADPNAFDLSSAGMSALVSAGASSLMIDHMRRSSRPLPHNSKKPFRWAGYALGYALLFYSLRLR